ncbi:MAG: DUF4410 domain-containing protein [Candidatus Electrothrix sp. AUS4]|nr:DUF4410 domain-containing protein [Candidatus Electrothrix sp. AUS4]
MKQLRILKVLPMLILILLSACASQKTGTDATVQNTQADIPLTSKYDNIVFYEFETTDEIKNDYPEAANECLASAMSGLLMKNVYKKVAKSNDSNHSGLTLLVKTKIPEMRIVSTGARIWGGALAGSSYMNMEIEFIDAASGKVLRTKSISSSSNAFAAAWTGGSNDKSLPADMGKILADYIVATVPSR